MESLRARAASALCTADSSAADCTVRVAVDSCPVIYQGGDGAGQLQLGRSCLTISRRFSLALIAGTCYENLGQGQLATIEECLDVTSGQ